MYIKRKIFSTYIDENGEEKLYSTTEIMSEESYLEKLYSENEPEQKEFNSKAAKALNRKYLGQYATDHEIPKIILMMKKEPLNPQTIKKNSRMYNKFSHESGTLSINERINNRSQGMGASSVDPGRSRNRAIRNKNHPFRKEYDHGDGVTNDSIKSIVANNPWTGEIGRTRGELKRLRQLKQKGKVFSTYTDEKSYLS